MRLLIDFILSFVLNNTVWKMQVSTYSYKKINVRTDGYETLKSINSGMFAPNKMVGSFWNVHLARIGWAF